MPLSGNHKATATGLITTATGIGGVVFTALTGYLGDMYETNILKVSNKNLDNTYAYLELPQNIKDADKIPDIIFHNDTDDICINPVIKARNLNKYHGGF